GVRAGVGCVLVLATSVTAFLPAPLPGQYNEDAFWRNFPCPEDAAIAPCICSFSDNFTLTCSDLDSKEQLAEIFKATFPINRFDYFVLENSNIGQLQKGVFGDIAFSAVMLDSNNLTLIDEEVFATSYNFLKQLYIYEDNMGDELDFPIKDINQFTKLEEIDISGPYKTIISLTLPELTSARLSLDFMSTLPATTFTGAPNLITLTLESSPIINIEPDTFKSLTHLESLEILYADLSNLVESSFAFNSENLTYVYLSENNIQTIEVGALAGIHGEAELDLSSNRLEELQEGVFIPVVKELTSGHINLAENPLLCGCDLLWIASLSDEEKQRLQGVAKSCNINTEDYDMDTLLDFLVYQCSTHTPGSPQM
ncbi:hypothetical protein OTU49_007110, partial [Cherax quadricarinatus]